MPLGKRNEIYQLRENKKFSFDIRRTFLYMNKKVVKYENNNEN